MTQTWKTGSIFSLMKSPVKVCNEEIGNVGTGLLQA
jgi:hypothetical protein